jgi:hypothetical protein
MIAGLVKGTLLCTEESPRKTPFTALNHPASCSVIERIGAKRMRCDLAVKDAARDIGVIG